jgi:hypothetical protein
MQTQPQTTRSENHLHEVARAEGLDDKGHPFLARPAQGTLRTQRICHLSRVALFSGGNVMMLTKDELTAAILASAAKLGKTPTRGELMALSGATPRNVRKHFGSYQSAMEACGLEINGAGKKVTMQSLFQDWTGIVRRLKKVPSLMEYEQLSRYSVRPMLRMFGMWVNVPDGIKMYIERHSGCN